MSPTALLSTTLLCLILASASAGRPRALQCRHKRTGDYVAVIHDADFGTAAYFKAYQDHRSWRIKKFVRCANRRFLLSNIRDFYKYALGNCYHARCTVTNGSCTCTDDFPVCEDQAYIALVRSCPRPSPTPTSTSTPSPSPSPKAGIVRLVKCSDKLSDNFFAVAHDGQHGAFARFKAIRADETTVDAFVKCGNRSDKYSDLESYFQSALGYCHHARCEIGEAGNCQCFDAFELCTNSAFTASAQSC